MQHPYFPIRSIEVRPLVLIGFYQLGKLQSLDLLRTVQVFSMISPIDSTPQGQSSGRSMR